MQKIAAQFSAQVGRIRDNTIELWTLAMISVGLPFVFFVYIDWRAALTVFVVSQSVIGLLSLRGAR